MKLIIILQDSFSIKILLIRSVVHKVTLTIGIGIGIYE